MALWSNGRAEVSASKISFWDESQRSLGSLGFGFQDLVLG
jgi:hypothetical protein